MKNLKKIIASALDCNETELEENSSSETIPSWDSFGMLQIIVALEKEYNIRFTHQEMINFSSIKNIEIILLEKLNEK